MYIVCFGDLLNTEHFHALYTALLLVIVDYILRLPRVAFHVSFIVNRHSFHLHVVLLRTFVVHHIAHCFDLHER